MDFLGVTLARDSTDNWNAVAFTSPEELGAWYAATGAGVGSNYRYVAAIDKTRPTMIVADLALPEVDDVRPKIGLGVIGALCIGGAVLFVKGLRDVVTPAAYRRAARS